MNNETNPVRQERINTVAAVLAAVRLRHHGAPAVTAADALSCLPDPLFHQIMDEAEAVIAALDDGADPIAEGAAARLSRKDRRAMRARMRREGLPNEGGKHA